MSKATKKPRTRAKPAPSIPPFLHKIYEILESPNYYELVSWNPEGDAFMIKNVTEFTEKVLPKYFKHNNFASFVRQLNLYGFHKSRYENNGSEFHHKLFKRGEKHLLTEIKRKGPGDDGSDGTSPFPSVQEEVEERAVQVPFVSPNSLQDIIARQERLENAMKVMYTENKRLSKDNKLLWGEVIKLKTKQSNTDKATKALNEQNSQLLNDNRRLWGEVLMTREKYERQVEKLLMFVISAFNYSGNNPLSMLQKKNARGNGFNVNNNEDDIQYENTEAPATENNSLSIIPVSKANKSYPRKGKSRLDALFERLEKDSKNNFFATIFEEKELTSKLASLLDPDSAAGNKVLSSLEYLTDKRTAPMDYSFEGEDKMTSKFCPREESNWEHHANLFDQNENTDPIGKYNFMKPPTMEEITEDMGGVGLGSPMNLDAGSDFDIAPLKGKDSTDFPNIGLFSHFGHCPQDDEEVESEGEIDDHEEEKKDTGMKNDSFFENEGIGAPINFLQRMNSNRSDDNEPWMSPTNFLRRASNLSGLGLGQDRFFTPSKNNSGLDLNTSL